MRIVRLEAWTHTRHLQEPYTIAYETVDTATSVFVTLGILPPEETVRRARERVAQGFRALELEGGRDIDQDIARVRQVRDAVGPDIELHFDANQGYSVEEAPRFVRGVASARLGLFEGAFE